MTQGISLRRRRIWVAGHRGMVGSAIVRALEPYQAELVTVDRDTVDLRRQAEVEKFVMDRRPELVFVAAARVGGILANSTYPAQFLYDNLMIAANVIDASYRAQVQKLMFLGSTCIYPRDAPQPLREEALLTGPLEPTNEWYAIAKIGGIKLCQAYRKQHGADFISAMPTNLYGPEDNFDPNSSHVLPALMRKIHQAKLRGEPSVTLWGTGRPRREFMHVDDLARALLLLMQDYSDVPHINVGTGVDCTIAELAEKIAAVVGYRGSFQFDPSKPDGTPRKCTDVSRLLGLGFRPGFDLETGLRSTYAWYLQNQDRLRER